MNEIPIPIDVKKITIFCKKYHIAFLALFGSILTPNFKDVSDVDLLVKFEQGQTPSLFDLVDMETELCVIIGRKVDLRTPNELSCYFRDEVLEKARVIYEG